MGHYLSYSVNNDIDPRLLNRGFTEDQLKQMRKAMGNNSVIGLNLKFTTSLKSIRHPNFNFIYTLYNAWDKHHVLPFEGSFATQPNKMVDYFNIFDELKYESEKKAHAKAMQEMNKKRKNV